MTESRQANNVQGKPLSLCGYVGHESGFTAAADVLLPDVC